MPGLAAGGGEWGFILPDYDVAAAAAWLLCHGPDPRPTATATATANTLRFTTRYNRQQRATTTHHITAQHNISFFFRTPGPRLVRCSVLAACRSSQQRSAFRPPPSPAHITSQRWPNILQIFYTAEYLHISVITARTRGRGCLGSGYGGVC